MTDGTMVMPDEVDLLEFFGVEPVEQAPEDGFWCWEVEDSRGFVLRFSLNILERSVQTVLLSHGEEVVRVSHENATDVRLTDRTGHRQLVGTFESPGQRTVLAVTVGEKVVCEWATLATR